MVPLAPFIIDGAEHGRLGTGVNGPTDTNQGTPAIVTSPTRATALRAYEISASAAAERVAYTPPSGASGRQLSVSFYIYFASLPGANIADLYSFGNANGPGQLQWNAGTSRFRLAHNNVGSTDFGPTITTGTWYLVDLAYDCSTGTVSITGRVSTPGSGGTVAGEPTTVSRSQTAADCAACSLGTLSAVTFTAYYDDLVVVLGLDAFPIGPHAIVSLIPTADGTHSIAASGDFDSFTATAFDNTTTNGNTFIGHRPLQFANTANQVIRQDTANATEYMELLFEDLPAAVDGMYPAAVRTYGVHIMSSSTGTPTSEMRLMLADDTEVLTTGSVSMIETLEDPAVTVTLRKRMAIAPAGGWTRDLVNGLKVRLGYNNITADAHFIDCLLEVLMLPPSPPWPDPHRSMRALARR